MALLFMDGFDHYVIGDILKKWSTTSNAFMSTTAGRRGGGCLNQTVNNSYTTKALPSSYSTIIVGFARTAGSVDISAFGLREGATEHLTLQWAANGKIKILRGSTVLGYSTNVIQPNGYNYFEIKATIHDTAGALEVRINGVSDANLTLSGIDTRNGGTSGVVDTIALLNFGQFDDVYVCDTSGATNNDFLGDCRIDTLFPTSDGNYSQYTPSTGTTHYTLVDETAPNTTDYNSGINIGDRDSYGYQDLAAITSQNIYGVQINAAVLKSDAGAKSLATMSRLSSTNKDGTGVALSTSQVYVSQIQETDPSSATWTEANINAAEFGTTVTA